MRMFIPRHAGTNKFITTEKKSKETRVLVEEKRN